MQHAGRSAADGNMQPGAAERYRAAELSNMQKMQWIEWSSWQEAKAAMNPHHSFTPHFVSIIISDARFSISQKVKSIQREVMSIISTWTGPDISVPRRKSFPRLSRRRKDTGKFCFNGG